MTKHKRTVRLPHGFRATFTWSHPYSLGIEWEPDVPLIRSPRAQRRFFAAYKSARDDFVREVATMTGFTVGMIDTGDYTALTVIDPEARH